MYEHVDLFGFDFFCQNSGCEKYAEAPTSVIKKYEGIFPEFLLAVWERHGFTSHGDGYVWTVNPDDYTHVILDFFGKEHNLIIFARNSFGGLYAVKDEYQYIIRPQVAMAHNLGKNGVENLFKYGLIMLNDEEHKKHLKTLKKLGPIDQDHMYGYVPMLALGGNGSLKETKIVKTQEYLALLADVVIDAKRNGWNPLGLNEEEESA